MTLLKTEFARGVQAAAGVMEGFNSTTTNAYRLDDVLLCKFNVVRRAKPRRNKKKLQHPDSAWVVGVAYAAAEAGRRGEDILAVEIARSASITIAVCKSAGVDAFDWRALKRAGVR